MFFYYFVTHVIFHCHQGLMIMSGSDDDDDDDDDNDDDKSLESSEKA
jgi:hypothetical protein